MKKMRGWMLTLQRTAVIFMLMVVISVPNTSYAAVGPPYEAFLKIEGVPGESQDTAHKDWIELYSWSWGDFTSSASPTGGGAPARPDPTFTFTMPVNKATPNLFLFHATGKRVTKAALAVQRPGAQGPAPDFLTITFDDIVISTYQSTWSTKDPNLPPIDEITLKFVRVTIEYKDRSGHSEKVTWDYKKSVP